MPFSPKKIEWSILINDSKIKDIGDCHICTSHKIGTNGYPMIGRSGKVYVMSRYIYSLSYLNGGDIPNGFVVRHKCDRPSCINPQHLELGTQAQNILDRKSRGRNNSVRGEDSGKSKLTNKDVIEIFYSKDARKIISQKYNISISVIDKIRSKEAWKHITSNL